VGFVLSAKPRFKIAYDVYRRLYDLVFNVRVGVAYDVGWVWRRVGVIGERAKGYD